MEVKAYRVNINWAKVILKKHIHFCNKKTILLTISAKSKFGQTLLNRTLPLEKKINFIMISGTYIFTRKTNSI